MPKEVTGSTDAVPSEEDVKTFLQNSLQIQPEYAVVEPLSGGLSNRNFKVSVDVPEGERQTLIVRVPGDYGVDYSYADIHLIDRRREKWCMELSAEAGISPHLVAFDVDTGLFASKFVAGRSLLPDDLKNDKVREQIASCLKNFHSIKVDEERPKDDAVDRKFQFPIDKYFRIAVKEELASPSPDIPLEKLRNMFGRVTAQIALLAEVRADKTLTLTHNDLCPANFILTENDSLRLVDYEYAGVGDPLADIGNYLAVNDLNDKEGDKFLSAYFKCDLAEIDEASFGIINGYRSLTFLREAMWGLIQNHLSNMGFSCEWNECQSFTEYSAEFLKRAKSEMEKYLIDRKASF